ncbi:MAG TPA: urate hydroxylase PuuD [Thermoanaerobaculia bacterium]|nr:urate hydroxylase PuuD [Thermoanaerobaculia bacterium]
MEIMDGELHNWLQLIFRWVHVVASILWLGLLYFFVLIQAHAARNIDEAGRRAAIPQLMPRALYWFRWAAVWTWISGFLLAILMYYLRGGLFEEPGADPWLWLGIYLGVLAVSLVIYHVIMTRVRRVVLANGLALILFAGIYALLDRVGGFIGAALYIHAGMAMGTAMAMNVWLAVWPAQRRIVAAIAGGTAPEEKDVRDVATRARQNAYMSIPLVFLMIANHYPTIVNATQEVARLPLRDWYLLILLVAGFIAARLLLDKAARVTAV